MYSASSGFTRKTGTVCRSICGESTNDATYRLRTYQGDEAVSWGVFIVVDDFLHVAPVDAYMNCLPHHQLSERCPCKPLFEEGVWIHNEDADANEQA